MISKIKQAVDSLVCTDLKVVLYGLVDSFEKHRWVNMKKYANKCIDREVWGIIKSIELERVKNILDMIYAKIDKNVIDDMKALSSKDSKLNSPNLKGLLDKIDTIEIMFNGAEQTAMLKNNANRLNILYVFANNAVETKYLRRPNEIHV